MKRKGIILLFLLFGIFATAMAQKKVAVWDIKVIEGTISQAKQLIIKSALENAISKTSGYVGYTRDLDKIIAEQKFQRSGNVSDNQIRKLGEMAGVDYILVTDAAYDGEGIVVSSKLLNIESGAYGDNGFEVIENTTQINIQAQCTKLAQRLFGNISTTTPGNNNYNTASKVPAGYVDLGLPSGTKWKNNNESGFYTYDQAVNAFGNKLPTKAQLEELKTKCQWTWDRNKKGYTVTGPNGNSIDLPAAGDRFCDGSTRNVGSGGYYCSSTSDGSDKAWSLDFGWSSVNMYSGYRCFGLSVRLVQ